METVKFTANEITVLKAIVETGQHDYWDGTLYYYTADLVNYTGKSVNTILSTLRSLRDKLIIYPYPCPYQEDVFDGRISEDDENLIKSILKNVNPQNNETKNDTENDENLTTDERIIYIQEILLTKPSSSLSKGECARIRDEKLSAAFILEYWDNADNLKDYTDDEECKAKHYKIWCIAKSRIDQLNNAAKVAKAEEQTATNEIIENNDETTSETTPAASETPKTYKTTVAKKTVRSKHEVGDLHPTKDWVWTEYAPGKFDWRTNKHDNPEVNRKERERDLGTDKPKPAKKAAKAKNQAEKPVKVRTIEEILATKPSGMSDSQERAFKLLRKGYRIDPNAATPQGYTLIKDGKTMVIIEGVMNALLNRMKVTPDEINQFKA